MGWFKRRPRARDTRSTWPGPTYIRAGAHQRALLLTTQTFAAAIRANVPIHLALEQAVFDAPDDHIATLFRHLSDDLRAGGRLHEAIAALPAFFPPEYAARVAAGEASGTLLAAFDDLSRESAEVAKRRFTAAIGAFYIWYIAMLHVAVLAFFVGYVVDELVTMLADWNVDTAEVATLQILTAIPWSDWQWEIIAGIAALALAPILFPLLSRGRHRRWWRNLPLIRRLGMRRHRGEAMRVLGILLGAGLPLHEALDTAARLTPSNPLGEALSDCARRVREDGASLAEAFAAHPAYFGRELRALATLGETAAMLPESLELAGDTFVRRHEAATLAWQEALLPLGVIAVGVLTFLVAGNMMLILASIATGIAGSGT
jgi:type II secretory pathway component PulF